MKKRESLRIFILGVLLYFSPKFVFFTFSAKWFPDLQIPDGIIEQVNIMRHNFWKTCIFVFFFIALILAIQNFFFNANFTTKHWLQVAGVFIALTAALGRGGWSIQTAAGDTPLERIDRGMFVISEFGATGILLFVLMF